jgi:hypothetical protein
VNDVPRYAEDEVPPELAGDEFDDREGCPEVDPELLELHEVLEWQHGGPLP